MVAVAAINAVVTDTGLEIAPISPKVNTGALAAAVAIESPRAKWAGLVNRMTQKCASTAESMVIGAVTVHSRGEILVVGKTKVSPTKDNVTDLTLDTSHKEL